MEVPNESICKFYRGGHCKFGESCRKSHQIETCSSLPCRNEVCPKRHPPLCKFYARFGRCKFQTNCSYLHQIGYMDAMNDRIELLANEMKVLKAQNDVLHSEVIKLQNEITLMKTNPNFVNSDVNFMVDTNNVSIGSYPSSNLAECQQTPIYCIRYENGCRNIIRSYYTKYTAICEPCTTYLKKKLKTTPYSHKICPCCHEVSNGPPLSLCQECLDDIKSDGWTESGFGAWHLDRNTGEILCISLDFRDFRIPKV